MTSTKFKFLIPSYKRSDKLITLEWLIGMGYGYDDITIVVQTEEDFELYKRAVRGRCDVYYGQATNLSGNRNNAIKYCEERGIDRMVMLDDDITSWNYHPAPPKKVYRITKRKELDMVIGKMFDTAERAGCKLWGLAPTTSQVFNAGKKPTINQFIRGGTQAMTAPFLLYNVEYPLKEDWEHMLRFISQGGRVIRFDSYSVTAKQKTNKGGCEKFWADKELNRMIVRKLVACYPDLVEPKENGEELKRI